MKALRAIYSLLVLIFLCISCHQISDDKNLNLTSATGNCTFQNPVDDGADPWVIRHDKTYYTIQAKNDALYISESRKLTQVFDQMKKIWVLPASGWNRSHLWAPELHFIKGSWFIYYTAGKSGPPFIHQRSFVLRSKTESPYGPYEDLGMLYTGDNIKTGENNKWAIDLTVLKLNNQLYALWSGWINNQSTDKTPQHLYIAKMKNPWTVSSNRVKISSPVNDWEKGTELPINEGPQILKHRGKTFVIYSASESWLVNYKLGQLYLKDAENPLNPDSWVKSGPVFQHTEKVHGVGHASFTVSPDSSEYWIIYHSKVDTVPGWNRNIRMQKFRWSKEGIPLFGKPIPTSISIEVPSGECANNG